MIAVALIDHRTSRIPNWLVAPVMLGAGAYRLIEAVLGQRERFFMLLAWALLFLLWMLHFMGGGDAKFLMAMYALFPSMEFTAVLAFFLLVLTIPLLLLEMRGRSLHQMRESVTGRLVTGQILPTEEELQVRGRQYAWTFAIPGIVYTWLYW
jgi:Flp pilus assembly protein protease CpaA